MFGVLHLLPFKSGLYSFLPRDCELCQDYCFGEDYRMISGLREVMISHSGGCFELMTLVLQSGSQTRSPLDGLWLLALSALRGPLPASAGPDCVATCTYPKPELSCKLG